MYKLTAIITWLIRWFSSYTFTIPIYGFNIEIGQTINFNQILAPIIENTMQEILLWQFTYRTVGLYLDSGCSWLGSLLYTVFYFMHGWLLDKSSNWVIYFIVLLSLLYLHTKLSQWFRELFF